MGGQVTLAKVVRNDDAREIAVTLKNNSSQQVQFIWRPAFFDMQDPRAEYRDELARWQEAFIPSKGSLDVKLTVHLTPPVVPGIVFRRK